MPIRTITVAVVSTEWTRWLDTWLSPIAASTAENASSTGRPAATNAPKAISRIRNVSGTESFSARERSLETRSFIAFSMLASPTSAIV